MSQPKSNVTICAICRKPKAPTLTTQQAPPQAKWPTYWQDMAYMAKRFDEHLSANQRRSKWMAPSPPSLIPPKEAS